MFTCLALPTALTRFYGETTNSSLLFLAPHPDIKKNLPAFDLTDFSILQCEFCSAVLKVQKK